MAKYFNIRFCWAMRLPISIVYDSETVQVTKYTHLVKAENQQEVLKKLKGTDTKIIGDIRSITECTR